MSKSRLEFKVGLFVLVCLVLLGALLLQFSKGTLLLKPGYDLHLTAKNVGGLKNHATVLMSGVQVGTVSSCELAPDGKSVTIHLRIYAKYSIYNDARFVIDQSGFLGDQYVAIIPRDNKGEKLGPGGTASAEEPFDIQAAERSAMSFITDLHATAKKIDGAVDDVRRLALNETTLGNVSNIVQNLAQVSIDARATAAELRELVRTNQGPAQVAASNLVAFSDRLLVAAQTAQNILSNGAPRVDATLGQLQASTASLTNLLGDLQAGRGLAGELLKDDRLAADFARLAGNLTVTSSNLNQLGLWRLFFPKNPKPTPPPTSAPAKH